MRKALLILAFLLPALTFAQSAPPKREFRAVWICTLANLDWPSSARSGTWAQQAEFRRMLDRLEEMGMNALIVQVRPAGDAFYESELVPWSQYLTGKQGKAPVPFYDPLAFMIEECHARNIEFHAWFNPFRALSSSKFSSVAENNIMNQHTDWVYDYGDSKYFDPGIPSVREHIIDVIVEVVEKYDVDGVHLDDYFYPYPIRDQSVPDAGTFVRHGKGFSDRGSWRRHNVDEFVAGLSDSIYFVKPWVKFGISPFGVWRNLEQDVRGSDTRRSLSAYDELYADTRKWLLYGWVDYMAPQLYWAIKSKSRASFDELLIWWSNIVPDRHVYIGHAAYLLSRENPPDWADRKEFLKQTEMCRNVDGVCGNIWFRASTMMKNPDGFTNALRKSYYRYPALVPSMPWLDSIPPNQPVGLRLRNLDKGVLVSWDQPESAIDQDYPTYYIVYRFDEKEMYNMDDPRNIIAIRRKRSFLDEEVVPGKSYTYVITSVDRLHNESQRFVYQEIVFGEEGSSGNGD